MMPLMPIAATSETPVPRRALTLAIGLLLVSTGVAGMIRAEVGVAPYDVLTTGIAERTGLAIGIAAMILPVLFTGLGMALGGKAGPGSIVCVLAVGPVLQLTLDLLPEVEAMVPRLGLFVVGVLMVAAGVTGVIVASLGSGPAEVLMLAVHERGVELARARTAIELASVAVGWVLGGQVGVGTAVFALTIGPMLRTLLRWSGYRPDQIDDAAVAAEPGA
jgi:uncharacterized membrane protein YczE